MTAAKCFAAVVFYTFPCTKHAVSYQKTRRTIVMIRKLEPADPDRVGNLRLNTNL